jgi:hypothetical protein
MGAWGHGSFENDDAADWDHEFELQSAWAIVSDLEYVSKFPEDEYLEAPEASAVIAAAKIVAAPQDSDLSNLSDDARKIFSRHQQSLRSSRPLELARQAVERILQQSELKDLWEKGKESAMWLKSMETSRHDCGRSPRKLADTCMVTNVDQGRYV